MFRTLLNELIQIQEPRIIIFQIRRIDTRTRVFEIPPQQILSTDSVTLTVDAVIYYRCLIYI